MCISWLCVCVFVCVFWYACPVEKVQSCNSFAIWKHTYHKACHTSVRIPLTSLVPADFLCGAVRGQQKHTHSHNLTHTPTLQHTHSHEQTYIHTLLRQGHHATLGLNHRSLDISICVTQFVHILNKTEMRVFADVCLLLWLLKKKNFFFEFDNTNVLLVCKAVI